MTRVMGIDPGFASFGWSVVEGDDDASRGLVACSVITTEKNKAPRAELRVSVDDSRRMGEICVSVARAIELYNVAAVAVEVFTVVRGKMGGGAVKTAMAYGALYALVHARGLVWLPLVPTDLKRALCGRVSASKTEIQAAVAARCRGAEEVIQALTKGKREHAADAIAAAIVGQEELRRLSSALGGLR
jgi:Holliday junction resolvasome RuvABC endonuclease subunit